jgi:sec-independent protein translocase protein TatC
MVASPVIIYQFWMFVAPGLYDREKRLMIPIVLLSTIFFVGGALFGYFIVFPYGFRFLPGVCHGDHPAHALHEGVSELFGQTALAFGLVFELPLVITFLAKLGIVTVPFSEEEPQICPAALFRGRRHPDTAGRGDPDHDGPAADGALRNQHHRGPDNRHDNLTIPPFKAIL